MGQVGDAARYLGPIIQVNQGAAKEVDKRAMAAAAGWRATGRIWHQQIPFPLMRAIFQAKVMGALLTGLESMVPTSKQVNRLNNVAYNYAKRIVLTRDQLRESSVGKYSKVSARSIYKKLKMAPVAVELRKRRLNMLRETIRRPDEHKQYVTALWSTPRCCSRDMFSPEGLLERWANPWARQAAEDLEAFMEIEEAEHLKEELVGMCLQLWRDQQMGEDFCRLDVTILRVMERVVEIPPPGVQPKICVDGAARETRGV